MDDENNRHKSWDLKVWVLYKIITSTSLVLRKNKLGKMKYDFRQATILKVNSWLQKINKNITRWMKYLLW